MTSIKVEIGQYREVNKGPLKAFFSLVIHPTGQKILDCRYFFMDGKEWWSFPQKEIKKDNKSEFIPYVSYLNKEYLAALKEAVIKAIKEHHEKGGSQGSAPGSVPSDAPVGWF